jgi:mannose-1-phosphate guanylyltransferase
MKSTTRAWVDGTDHLWSILLAAGDGKRVQPLTGELDGAPVPKQFYRPGGNESMLRWTVKRAADLVPVDRIVPVVASRHRRWWKRELADIPASNIVVQPLNRGTAAGILLPLLRVQRLDPMAKVLVLPTDHYVEHESRLREAIDEAIDEANRNHDTVVLVGSSPSADDTECGWILPRLEAEGALVPRVAAFIEKPGDEFSRRLARRGAVVNTLIMVATVDAMVKLFERAVPELVEKFTSWSSTGQGDLDDLYRILPNVDFSREVLEGSCDLLSVVRATGCGWMDLGTPARLDTCQQRLRTRTHVAMSRAVAASAESHPRVHQTFGRPQRQGSAL